jgi:inosine-uridine nucleoside N-ribohydrolase
MKTTLLGPGGWWIETLTAVLCIMLAGTSATGFAAQAGGRPIPVILDTDIGDDIDDTWALGLLLKCPELDLRMVVSDYGRPTYRTRLLAKLLVAMGRSDVPIGVGIEVAGVGGEESQGAWLGDYDLKTYPGRVHADGVQAMIDLILSSPEPVTLIAIGPLSNVAEALKREPRIAGRARFIGMHGSVRVGYGGSTNVAAEWNVKCAPAACRAALSAPWEVTITPLDTCGLVQLSGASFTKVRESKDPVAQTILANYRVWAAKRSDLAPKSVERLSSTLFDCVAIYLATGTELCGMERLPIGVTDEGFTRIEPGAKPMQVATSWKRLESFHEWMAERLTRPNAPASGR